MKDFLKRIDVIHKKLTPSGSVPSPVSLACEQEEDEEQQFNADFRKTLVELEQRLHITGDPRTITMEALKTVCTFHKADWTGILIVDKSMEMWSPAVWYDPELGEMAPTLFNEIEYFEYFPRWVDALKTGEPVVFSDVSAAEGMTTDEAAQYERLATHGVIGAPFTEYLTGFLVVRNPQRYPCIPDLVQMLAFVTLSTYYLQELQEGMQMMHRSKENRSFDTVDVTINLFGVPEIITTTGQINEEIYHSENGWKLLTFLALRKTPVPSRTIATAIWPDEDQDLKSDNIRHIIYRFRSKLSFLQTKDLLVNTISGYCLNPELKIRCDVDEFDQLCSQAEKTLEVQKKIDLLQKAVSLYRGDIYAKYSHEHWLMADVANYQLKYLNITSKLMSLLSDRKDYRGVQEVALKAIKIMPGNVNACYWMTVSLYRLGGRDVAQKMADSLRMQLTDEEVVELRERLKKELELY
ncbi:MAG: BTAD domain-containing putative transcriptional regulator [Fusicatenibacter sp.]